MFNVTSNILKNIVISNNFAITIKLLRYLKLYSNVIIIKQNGNW